MKIGMFIDADDLKEIPAYQRARLRDCEALFEAVAPYSAEQLIHGEVPPAVLAQLDRFLAKDHRLWESLWRLVPNMWMLRGHVGLLDRLCAWAAYRTWDELCESTIVQQEESIAEGGGASA